MSFSMLSSSLLLLSSVFSACNALQSKENGANLIRRLTEQEDEPTKVPTRSPTVIDCKVSWSGDALNPSTVTMALIDTGVDADDEHDIDLETGDTNLDGDNARIGLCEAKFGAGSKPVTPDDKDTWDAMVNLCEAMGNGHECYMGLYREDYNNGQSDCTVWRGEDATFTYGSTQLTGTYGATWANNNPSCPWLPSTDPLYDNDAKRHCLTYKTSSNKIVVTRCVKPVYIICSFHGICNP